MKFRRLTHPVHFGRKKEGGPDGFKRASKGDPDGGPDSGRDRVQMGSKWGPNVGSRRDSTFWTDPIKTDLVSP